MTNVYRRTNYKTIFSRDGPFLGPWVKKRGSLPGEKSGQLTKKICYHGVKKNQRIILKNGDYGNMYFKLDH